MRSRTRRQPGLHLPDTTHEAAAGLVHDASALAHEAAAALKPRLRGVLHETALAVSLVTGTALVCLARGAMGHVSAAIYAGSVALLFGTSAAYHRGSWSPRGHALMARLDHSMIFILIAGTYTPFCLLLLHGALRWVSFAVVWGGAVLGVVLRNAVRRPARWLFVSLYLGLGWIAVGMMPALVHRGGYAIVVLLATGGLCYTAGAVVYALRRPNPSPQWFGFHEVFHALTLAAFASHYVAVSLATYRLPAG